MKKRIGVVADDVTGANDIGVMFKKRRLSQCGVSAEPHFPL